MVVEDVHWIDPTSRELLEMTVERVSRLPVLFILTFRPEFQPPWTGQAHVTMLALNRLDRRAAAALAERVAGRTLPSEIVERIVERTDGIPLFVEELTKMILESGLLREQDGRYVLDGPLPSLAIPTTLHASLMARLDRLAADSCADLRDVHGVSVSERYDPLIDIARPRASGSRTIARPESYGTFSHLCASVAATDPNG
jgi:predicted ATPase